MEPVDEKNERKAIGGRARAAALPPEARREIARKAAVARWAGDTPQATHEGPVHVGNAEIMAAVLPDGTRVLSQGTFLRAIGRSRTPKGGTGGTSNVDGLPSFLQAEQLKPFISDDLRLSTTPVPFRLRTGQKSIGYRAEVLPMVCEVYLKFRDACRVSDKPVPATFRPIIDACDILMRGLARVGIVALVDEATGYQEVRDRTALQAILDRFLRKELAAWAKRFPDEFYQEIFRLRGWTWKGMSVNRPQAVGQYTKDIVYARLAPGVLKQLEELNPKDEKGNRRAKHHQWLTEDVGNPALAQHLHAVLAFMRVTPTGPNAWKQFMAMLNRAFPKRGDTLQLPFMQEDGTPLI
jgi:hypothetical protein